MKSKIKSIPKKKARRDVRRNVGRRVADDILHGLQAMVADLKGEKPLPGRKHVVHVVDIKALRKKLRVSQAQFATRFGINRRTLQDWEQGRSSPDQNHSSFLRVIASIPQAVERALA
jgi:putative transcriptional regulator